MLCTREVTVQVPDGLHHQTAARFIQTAAPGNQGYPAGPHQLECAMPSGKIPDAPGSIPGAFHSLRII